VKDIEHDSPDINQITEIKLYKLGNGGVIISYGVREYK
jgi:hypothetical protein